VYKLYAIWTAPAAGQEAEFERHYTEVHAPLAASIPGVRKLVLTRTTGALGDGAPALHRVTELWFDDEPAMRAAESSPAGQATIADAAQIQQRFGATLTSVAGPATEQPLT
jgi:uncharacterized protein (TIGR02118 family)